MRKPSLLLISKRTIAPANWYIGKFANWYFLFVFSGCVPVNSIFDSAKMLEQNQLEIRGNFSPYYYTEDGNELEKSNQNYGIGLGYGVSPKLNLKFRYELISFPDNITEYYHYYDIAPKFSLIENKWAIIFPLGVYAAKSEAPTFVLSPRILYTYSYNQYFEITASVTSDLFLVEDADLPIGLNLGFGVSTHLDKWALRPEAGYMFNPGGDGRAFTFGIGFNYYFDLLRPVQIM